MPHADSVKVANRLANKTDFYLGIQEQLTALLEGSRYWVTNLSQASALLYHAYLASPLYGIHKSSHIPIVNWVGFYLYPPGRGKISGSVGKLILGPYQGRPACLSITPIAGKGVCADAFTSARGIIVDDVNSYPGHIACDGETQSEIVIPLVVPTGTTDRQTPDFKVIGVFDLDSTITRNFDNDDLEGLKGILKILALGCDWN